MTRLPVLAIIRDAYAFAGNQLGAIIGAIWLPMVAVSVTGFFAMQRYYDRMGDAAAAASPAVAGPAVLMLMLQLVGALFLYAMMYTAVTQLALGNRKAGPMAFTFGRTEWRMVRALLGFVCLLMGIGLLLGVAGSMILTVTAPALSPPVRAGLESGLVLLLYAVLIFVVLRMLFFLPVAAVAEEGPVLARAWALSKGHSWRILAILLGVLGPLLVLCLVGQVTLLGLHGFAGAGPEADQAKAMLRMRQALPLIEGLAFLISPLLLGLPLSASVSAWRALTSKRVEIIA